MNICKKSLNVIMMLFILFNICACKNENKISESYPKIYDYLDSITIDTFKNQIKNKDTFIVYVGRPTCSDCELLDDRLISNIEEDSSLKKILYMNITNYPMKINQNGMILNLHIILKGRQHLYQ